MFSRLFPLLIVGVHCFEWRSAIEQGSIKGYLSYSEANSVLDSFLLAYPDFVSRQVIGSSFRGRDIHSYVVRVGPSKPHKLLLTSVFHANEPVTLWVSLHAIGSLLESLEVSSDIDFLFSSRELHVIPFVNPDGYADASPGGGFPFRKNRRSTCEKDSNLGGVDLNRNFDISWKHVGDPCSTEYAGTAPFSEPETQALRDYAISQKFTSVMNLHAFGSMLTFPFNSGSNELPLNHFSFYEQLQDVFQFEKFGPAPKTLNYTTFGESDDWFYSKAGALSMSPELGSARDGFSPDPATARAVAESHFARIVFWMYKAGGVDIASMLVEPSSEANSWKMTLTNEGAVELTDLSYWNVTIMKNSCDKIFTSLANLQSDQISSIDPLGGTLPITVALTGCSSFLRNSEDLSICMSSYKFCRCFTNVTASTFSVPTGLVSNPIPGMCGPVAAVPIMDPSTNWVSRIIIYAFLAVCAYLLGRIVATTIEDDRMYDAAATAPKGVRIDVIPIGRNLTYE